MTRAGRPTWLAPPFGPNWDAGLATGFAGTFGAGSHTIGVEFTNAASGGTASTSRDLYVDGINVNGTHYGSGVTALMSNGTASFVVTTVH